MTKFFPNSALEIAKYTLGIPCLRFIGHHCWHCERTANILEGWHWHCACGARVLEYMRNYPWSVYENPDLGPSKEAIKSALEMRSILRILYLRWDDLAHQIYQRGELQYTADIESQPEKNYSEQARDGVAQLAERRNHDPYVRGSSPRAIT